LGESPGMSSSMSPRSIFAVLILTLFFSSQAKGDTPLKTGKTSKTSKKLPLVATFSIVAFDPATGELGIAVQSKFVAVGAVVPWAKAGVGAIASQAFGNTKYGPQGLKLLAAGKTAEETVKLLTAGDGFRKSRQLGIVDAKGRSANFTGSRCSSWAGAKKGPNYTVQGNILAGKAVTDAMAKSFEESKGLLGDRLIAALEAGQKAGGDKRGRQSAALLIVRKGWGYSGYNDRFRDIRVDDHKTPIQELKRVFKVHQKFLPRPKIATPPIDDPKKLKSPWRHAKIGDWAKYQTNSNPDSATIHTVTKIEDGQLTLSIKNKGVSAIEVTRNIEDLDIYYALPQSLKPKPKNVKEKELKTSSGTLKCEIIEIAGDSRSTVHWFCREFPLNGCIVRIYKNGKLTLDLVAWKKN
ncbi:MAG: DUF1028 domain-containing protein, partial [Planctomycetota bacterium]|nr:DUF1028 domain-containing protein [Planctomycetota bacterium]